MSPVVNKLSNGFTVATDRMSDLRSATIAIYVQAGSRHEREDQGGIAHFLEHMAFKGTKTRTARQISQAVEDVGGGLNAYTSRDRTAYLARVLSKDISLAIDILADIILNPSYEPDEIELERRVILNEIHQYKDYPEDVVFEELQRTVYPGQAFGRSILGTTDLVAGYNRRDLEAFTTQHYHPGRMILCAAGDVDHDEALELAEKHFGHLPDRGPVDNQPTRFRSGEFRREKDVEQTQLVLAYEAPPILSELEVPAHLFAVAMGGGSSSRLFIEAREKLGLCYSISAQYMPHQDTGMFVIHASTRQPELAQLANCCADELRNSRNTLGKNEVERARTQIKVGLILAYESPMSRVERMASMLSYLGKVESIDATSARFDSVSVENVRDFAAGTVNERDISLALYGPIAGAPSRQELSERIRG